MYEIFEKLLKIKGVTAYRVAKETGISNATFSEWKKGAYTPKADKLQKIADYFGVSLEYLTTGKEKNTNTDDNIQNYAVKIANNEELIELIEINTKLNNNNKKHLLKYAKFLKMEEDNN